MKNLSKLLFCFTTLFSNISSAQIITTIAGNGTLGFSGDGGLATAAQINSSYNVQSDAIGNVYIADFNNHRVRKVNTSGFISTFAGSSSSIYSGDGGPATAAGFGSPSGIAIDTSGNIYIADAGNSCIRKVDVTGIVSLIAGVPGSAGYSGDGGAATLAQLNQPRGLAIDNAGNLFVADVNNYRIRKISPAGIITTIAGNGSMAHSGDGLPATDASFRPTYVAVDLSNNIFFSTILPGPGNYSYIRKVNTSGIIRSIAGTGSIGYGGDGGPATAAAINAGGLCIDPYGIVIFGDGSNRIRKISPSGIITTIAGTGTAGFSGDHCAANASTIYNPLSVASDASGNIYILDNNNFRIRKLSAGNIPVFANGSTQFLSACRTTTTSINTLLTVTDTDVLQTINWSVLSAPTHGILTASYSGTVSTGTITPTGLSYTPTAPYALSDSFKIIVSDCGNKSDTTSIYVTIDSLFTDLSISGADSVCAGYNTPFSSPFAGGSWSSSNTTIATVSASGTITGISTGSANITYSINNTCGNNIATHPIYVKPSENCLAASSSISIGYNKLLVWPNPVTSGLLHVQMLTITNTDMIISIYDQTGRIVNKIAASSNTIIPVKQYLLPGFYLITTIVEGVLYKEKVTIVN